MWKYVSLILVAQMVTACSETGNGQLGWSARKSRNWSMLDSGPYGQTFVDQDQSGITEHQGTFKIVLPVSDDGRRSYTIIKLVRADCKQRKLVTVSSGAFGPDGDSFGTMPDIGWQPVQAKTSTEYIFNHLCGGSSSSR